VTKFTQNVLKTPLEVEANWPDMHGMCSQESFIGFSMLLFKGQVGNENANALIIQSQKHFDL
jgi:hypothetical protein